MEERAEIHDFVNGGIEIKDAKPSARQKASEKWQRWEEDRQDSTWTKVLIKDVKLSYNSISYRIW